MLIHNPSTAFHSSRKCKSSDLLFKVPQNSVIRYTQKTYNACVPVDMMLLR
jgi:hypothetical protein